MTEFEFNSSPDTPAKPASGNGPRVSVTFQNDSNVTVEMFWHDFQGELVSYGIIQPEATMEMSTFATHPWSFKGVDLPDTLFRVDGQEVFVPVETDDGRFISITKGNFTDTLTDSRPTSTKESVITFHGELDDTRDDNY